MPSPVPPSRFLGAVPSASGSVCDKFQKAFKIFPQALSDWFSYAYNEDGSFTDAFKADVCAINCAALAASGGPAPGGALATPSLTQSGHAGTSIVLNWAPIPGGSYYELVRNTENDLYNATFAGSTVNTTITDTGLTDMSYYFYWLRAVSPTNISAFSSLFIGLTSSTGATPTIAATTVVSSAGTIPDYVASSWTAVQGASTYDVYRNLTNTFTGATLLFNTPQLFYNDHTGVAGTGYYYMVQSKGLPGVTSNSAGVVGFR